MANGDPKRVDRRDFKFIAEFIIDEWGRRKRERRDIEKQWEEIDRQVAMKPDIRFKQLPNGKVDTKKMWMAEMELPLQAQALEVLTADARRMMFPDSGPWFRANAEMTDEFLRNIDFQSLILGDENEVPSQINQDNANKLVEGFLQHQFRQYDHVGRWDRINAEAFRYGMGVGRARLEEKNVWIHEAKGTRREKQKIPVIVPVSIKHLYLDDPMPSMHSAQVLGPGHIAEDWIDLSNLRMAANRGSTDPDDQNGGWMPKSVDILEPDRDNFVQILEFEGDLVVPRRTTKDIVIPGVIVTVAKGATKPGGQVSRSVVRFRFRKKPYSSYLLAPYHFENADDIYPSGPLMKGRPVQIMGSDALNRLMDAAMLKNAPPIGYDRSDQVFAQSGGPEIHPYAKWETTDAVNVYDEIGGDQSALSNTLSLAISLYSQLTGILPARLGAQTVSHTTAFAKDAELQRGASRTVDYVRATGQATINRWLDMVFDMARDEMPRGGLSFFSDAYGGFIEITRRSLPDKVSFEWFGAAGPQDEQARLQARLQALQLALQMDQLSIQQGNPPTVSVTDAIRQTLRDGGWQDLDAIINPQAETALQVQSGAPGNVSTALQALAFGGGQ